MRLRIHEKYTRQMLFIVVFGIIILAVACSVPPPESTIKDLINRHFEKQQYRVVEIVMGEISSQPIGEVKYMGTKGYHIAIERLTLERRDDKAGQKQFAEGERMTFSAHWRSGTTGSSQTQS